MRTILLLLALLALFWASLLGFGVTDDPNLTDDYGGWLAAGLFLAVLSEVPFDDLRRRR